MGLAYLGRVASVLLLIASLGCGEPDPCGDGVYLVEAARKCTPPPPPAVCGNGWVEYPEECDDGNDVGGDGCENDCTIIPVCGNGVPEPGEECDDGNEVDGDGCETDCALLVQDYGVTCLASVPALDEDGLTIEGSDGEPEIASTAEAPLGRQDACTFHVVCPAIPGSPAFPIEVRPLPVVVAGVGISRVRLDQTLFVTSAVRAVLPTLESVAIDEGSVEYLLSQELPIGPFEARLWSQGSVILPAPGEATVPLEFHPAENDFADSDSREFGVALREVTLTVPILADTIVCTPIGETQLTFSAR